MMVTAWGMPDLVGDKPYEKGDYILMRGGNVSAVSRVTRCGGTGDKITGVLIRMLDRLETMSGWRYIAKPYPRC